MPGSWVKDPLRCVVREDQDQEIKVHLIGMVMQTKGAEVQAFGPDGSLINRTTVPAGRHASYAITLPKDGKKGEYVLLVSRADISLPLTTLSEVFLLDKWQSPRPAQYSTRSPGAEPYEISIGGSSAKLFSADKRTLLGFTDNLKHVKNGIKEVTRRVGPEGAWICGKHGVDSYVSDGTPVVVSTSPERWFWPDPKSLKLQSAP